LKKIEEVLNMLAEVFFSIFSCGCKQSNFSTQYGGKGICFYNNFLKTEGFLNNKYVIIMLKNILLTRKKMNPTLHFIQ